MKSTILGASKRLTNRTIEQAEKSLRRAIPPTYRRFLLDYNGGRPDPSDFSMAGTRKGTTQIGTIKSFLGINLSERTLNLDYVLEAFRNRIPARLFPVARDPGGNLICVVQDGSDAGKVYFWDHEREAEEGEAPTERNLYLIADSFDEFLDKLGKT